MNQEKLRELLHQGVDRHCASLPLDPDRVEHVLLAAQEEDRRARLGRKGGCLRTWRVPAAVFAALLMLFAGLTLRRGRLRTQQHDGGKQYLISGQKLPNESCAVAAPGWEYGAYTPATLEEARSLFATPPPAPQWLPEGWLPETYNVNLVETAADLTIIYTQEATGARLIYQFTRYADYSSIYQYVEQDGEGTIHTTPEGTQIYLTSNLGRQTASWHAGLTTCMLSGDVTREELIRIAESVR